LDSLSAILILAVGVAAIVVLTGKLHVHAFLAVIAVSILMGFALGLQSSMVVNDIVEGFGGTLGYVGLIALAACIVGELLKETGATVVISESILKLFGKSRSPLAVATAGYLVAPPVTCNDTAFLILSPIARSFGNAGRYSPPFVSLALAAGAYTSFKLIFPAAPLYAATMFRADLAEVILLGFLVSIPVFAVGLLWMYIYTQHDPHQVVPLSSRPSDEQPQTNPKGLPSAIESYGIIVVPLLLILARAFIGTRIPISTDAGATIDFVGHPVVAMLVAVGLAMFVARKHPSQRVSSWVANGVARGASIVAIVGAGGVLGKILIDADMGRILVSSIAGVGISGALTIFLVAAVIKTAQGSSVVTMVTAPSIVLPLLPTLGISPTFATLLVCAGAMISVHVNDSYFWVVTGFSQMSVVQGIRSLTAMSILQGLTVLVLILAINAVFPIA